MAKIHLRRNKVSETTVEIRAVCATNPYVDNSRVNSRSKYRFMSSEIVDFQTFKSIEESARCTHCVAAGLIVRNRQRKAKNLPPVNSLFE